MNPVNRSDSFAGPINEARTASTAGAAPRCRRRSPMRVRLELGVCISTTLTAATPG